MTHQLRHELPVTYRRIFAYFFPLALQAAAQSLTYPLVAMVASRGVGGTFNLAGLAQANSIMFLLGTIGAGLITTGMIYGKTKEGYAAFVRVNYILAFTAGIMQALICYPPLAHTVFGHLVGLPEGIEHPAKIALLSSIPLQILFFLRNPYQATLYNHNATGLASGATILRIAMTAGLSPVFSGLGLVGPFWAVVCMTIPVAGETLLSWLFSRRYLRDLPRVKGPAPAIAELIAFTMPLSIGGLFLALSGILIGAVIAHAGHAELMLPAYYLAAGLSGPMAFAASRVQAVTIAFAPDRQGHRTLLSFSVIVGSIVGFIPLLFILPGLADWYYVGLQKCRPEMLNLVRWSAVGLVLQPLAVSLRAYSEGRAAVLKKPVTILAGQGVFLAMLAVVSFLCLVLTVPGNLIAPLGLISANVAAALIINLSLRWEKQRGLPVAVKADAPEGFE